MNIRSAIIATALTIGPLAWLTYDPLSFVFAFLGVVGVAGVCLLWYAVYEAVEGRLRL